MADFSSMAPLRREHAHWLREEAAHCRRLATHALQSGVALELERIAANYEQYAATIEHSVGAAASRLATAAAGAFLSTEAHSR